MSAFISVAENEDALLRHLFHGYQKWVRPVQNSNDTIKVLFGLKISQLVDVVSVVVGLRKPRFFWGGPVGWLPRVMEGVGMGTPGLVLFAVKLKALPFLTTAPRD